MSLLQLATGMLIVVFYGVLYLMSAEAGGPMRRLLRIAGGVLALGLALVAGFCTRGN